MVSPNEISSASDLQNVSTDYSNSATSLYLKSESTCSLDDGTATASKFFMNAPKHLDLGKLKLSEVRETDDS